MTGTPTTGEAGDPNPYLVTKDSTEADMRHHTGNDIFQPGNTVRMINGEAETTFIIDRVESHKWGPRMWGTTVRENDYWWITPGTWELVSTPDQDEPGDALEGRIRSRLVSRRWAATGRKHWRVVLEARHGPMTGHNDLVSQWMSYAAAEGLRAQMQGAHWEDLGQYQKMRSKPPERGQ